MFSTKDFRILTLILTVLLFLHIPILFVIYDDLVYALAVSLFSGGLGCLSGLILESTIGIGLTSRTPSQSNIQDDLVPLSRLLAGLIFPNGLMWTDILTLSDEIGYLWFWSQFIAIYTYWILGVAVVRYRTILKSIYIRKRHEEIKSRTASDGNQDEELVMDDGHELQ